MLAGWRRSVGLCHRSGLPVLASDTSQARHETAHTAPRCQGGAGAPRAPRRPVQRAVACRGHVRSCACARVRARRCTRSRTPSTHTLKGGVAVLHARPARHSPDAPDGTRTLWLIWREASNRPPASPSAARAPSRSIAAAPRGASSWAAIQVMHDRVSVHVPAEGKVV